MLSVDRPGEIAIEPPLRVEVPVDNLRSPLLLVALEPVEILASPVPDTADDEARVIAPLFAPVPLLIDTMPPFASPADPALINTEPPAPVELEPAST